MPNDLMLVTSKQFDGFTLDCYVEPEQTDKGAFWATSEQIGLLLGYTDPDVAIRKIYKRNKERLSKFSTSTKLVRVEGDRAVKRSVRVYNFMGLLEICRYSQQPTANQVIDTLWAIADEIRRTGSYTTKMSAEDRELRVRELDRKDRELDLLAAQLLKDMLDAPAFPLTDESKAVIQHEYFKLISGHEYLAMLPETTEKWYTAGDIGEILGVSANKIGRLAKSNGLKPEQGQSNKYGRWIFSKSKYSSREVPSFIYSEAGLEWFRDYSNGICKDA